MSIISVAENEIGTKEYPANSNNVKYNTEYYGRVVSGSEYPWCVTFVWYIFKYALFSKLFYGGGKTASSTTLRNYYRNKGQTITSNYKEGDIIFFNFTDSSLNAKTSKCYHTAICVSSTSSTITTIDGNTGTTNESNGGEVMQKTRSIKYVVCGARPSTSVSTNSTIKDIQKILNSTYNSGLTIDGSFGPASQKALIKAVQTEENNIFGANLTIDGSFGPISQKAFKDVAYPDNNNMVQLIQIALIVNGEELVVDGSFGTKTKNAVKDFQNNNSLTVDGVVGKNTMKALLE